MQVHVLRVIHIFSQFGVGAAGIKFSRHKNPFVTIYMYPIESIDKYKELEKQPLN